MGPAAIVNLCSATGLSFPTRSKGACGYFRGAQAAESSTFLHSSFSQSDNAIGLRRQAGVMSDHDDSDLLNTIQGSQDVKNFFAVFSIEVPGRFVGQ
jgi:hypothetical protein